MKILIGIDDVHPGEFGWDLSESLKYLTELNKDYGAKCSLFVPAFYHSIYPIFSYKEWFRSINKFDFIEWCAHGCYHDTVFRKDECEFAELTEFQADNRIETILDAWSKIGLRPQVWKNPGWLCTQGAANSISRNFKIVHAHGVHDKDIEWHTTTITGHVGIDQKYIEVEGDILIFQSHINGPNNNNWTEENYLNLRNLLDEIKLNEPLEFLTFEELYNNVK